MLTAHAAKADESPAVRLGPHFVYIISREECAAIEAAFSQLPYEGLLDNPEMMQRARDVRGKLGACRDGGAMIRFSLPQAILTGFSLTRFNCREDDDMDKASCESVSKSARWLFHVMESPMVPERVP